MISGKLQITFQQPLPLGSPSSAEMARRTGARRRIAETDLLNRSGRHNHRRGRLLDNHGRRHHALDKMDNIGGQPDPIVVILPVVMSSGENASGHEQRGGCGGNCEKFSGIHIPVPFFSESDLNCSLFLGDSIIKRRQNNFIVLIINIFYYFIFMKYFLSKGRKTAGNDEKNKRFSVNFKNRFDVFRFSLYIAECCRKKKARKAKWVQNYGLVRLMAKKQSRGN